MAKKFVTNKKGQRLEVERRIFRKKLRGRSLTPKTTQPDPTPVEPEE